MSAAKSRKSGERMMRPRPAPKTSRQRRAASSIAEPDERGCLPLRPEASRHICDRLNDVVDILDTHRAIYGKRDFPEVFAVGYRIVFGTKAVRRLVVGVDV